MGRVVKNPLLSAPPNVYMRNRLSTKLFKFMDASFPGVCVVEAFHTPAIILCTPIARTQITF